MRRFPLHLRRRNVQCLVAVLLCLLTAQLALAAQACTAPVPMIDCAMAMPHAIGSLACVSHCTVQAPVPSDTHAPAAPANPWVVQPIFSSVVFPSRSTRAATDHPNRQRAPPRPRALLYCSLLI